MNGLAKRAFKITDRQCLVKNRRIEPALAAYMPGTRGKGFGRFEQLSAQWTERSVQHGEVLPAVRTEKRDGRTGDRRAAIRAGRGKEKIKDVAEKGH
jgi:hypothetical protein